MSLLFVENFDYAGGTKITSNGWRNLVAGTDANTSKRLDIVSQESLSAVIFVTNNVAELFTMRHNISNQPFGPAKSFNVQ